MPELLTATDKRRSTQWSAQFLVAAELTRRGYTIRQADRFFILTQAETEQVLKKYRSEHPNDKGKAPGFGFKDPQGYEDCWDNLPS